MMKPPKNLVYGIHAVKEAIDAGAPIDKVLAKQDNPHERVRDLVAYARKQNLPVQFVPDERLDAVCRDKGHQGIAATLAQVAYQSLESVILETMEANETPLFVMLDGVTDVRNFGAIARAAECMGAQALIIPSRGAAAVNGEAMKASAGALHHISVCRENNLVDAFLMLESYEIQVVACTEKAVDTHYEADFKQPTCLLLGAEDKGISLPLIKRASRKVGIPMKGQVSSLNVSVAAGIILAEALRQRSA